MLALPEGCSGGDAPMVNGFDAATGSSTTSGPTACPSVLGSDGQADGAARRRRGPRRLRANAAAELGAALAVAAPAAGGAAASEVGLDGVFAVADGRPRQAADYELRVSEQLRQMLESVSWRPARVR
ncbi:unnamed protein product [Prorocentrum cordatum]|uniref:Uncharacterized protein n=1 Tax=Prorocentrum cordatum TaxID=2364126 RepID=A0ABN9WT54_9DINO|nr:unnamed protein product [Polarella glacialis]